MKIELLRSMRHSAALWHQGKQILLIAMVLILSLNVGSPSPAYSGVFSSVVGRCRAALTRKVTEPERASSTSARDAEIATREVDWTRLPLETDSSLTQEFVAALLKTNGATRLREELGLGSGLEIEIADERYGERYGERLVYVSGWKLQMRFAQKALQVILPEANIRVADNHRSPNAIQLGINDSVFGLPMKPGMLDMQVLKAANPGARRPSRAQLRNEMGLPLNARIVSLYVALKSPNPRNRMRPLIERVLKSKSADIVIVSQQKFEIDPTNSDSFVEPGLATVLNSEDLFQTSQVQGDLPLVIYNSTRGRMSSIHAASDVSITLGAGNFTEAINSGGISLFEFQPRGNGPGSDPHAWERAAEVALATGRAHLFHDIDELPNLIQHALQQPTPILATYETLDASGRSALSRFADHLVEHVQSARSALDRHR